MSDNTITFHDIEFEAEALYRAIQENLTEDDTAHRGWNTTGLTITDEVVIMGDDCCDPDAHVADIESGESFYDDLVTIRDEIERTMETPFTEYLNDQHYVYDANEVVEPDDTPIVSANAVVKHDTTDEMGHAELAHTEVKGANDDENVEFSEIAAEGDVLYVGFTDKRDE